MEGETTKMLKLTMKQNSGQQFDVQIKQEGSTVLDLKQACAEKAGGMTPEEIRLIYKGKILMDDNTLVDYKIADGDTVHLVKSKAAGSQSQPASTTATTAPTTSTNPSAPVGGAQ